MSKAKQLFILNILLFAALLTQAVLIFSSDLLPHAVFIKTHMWVGRFLVILGIIHLIYNWGWVKSRFFNKGNRN